jgi:membrane-associated phospholipid phosphatase
VHTPNARAVTWPDARVLSWVVAHRFPLGDNAARAVMLVGTHRLVLAAAALLGLAWVVARRRYRLGAAVVLAVVVSALVAEVLKETMGRGRPPASAALVHAGGLSMPSTDAALTAAAAVALYLGVTWLEPGRRRLVGAVLVAGVLAVGVCLVYLGVHWTTDVAAGWALGAAVGAGAVGLTSVTRSGRRRSG